MNLLVWCAALALARGAGAEEAAAGREWRGARTYSLQTTVALAAGTADVSWRLAGALRVQDVPPPRALLPLPPGAQLLRFTLEGVHVQRRGSHARAEYRRHASAWDAQARRVAHALWARGRLLRLYLAEAEPALQDYERAVVSLFQFRLRPGERNETDVSGHCAALYEALSPSVLRKIKRACSWEQEADWVARRVARYTLGAGAAPERLHAEELLWLRGAEWAAEGGAPLRARSWHELALQAADEQASAAPPEEPLLEAPLPMALPHSLDLDDDDEPQDLERAVERWGAALRGEAAGEGGGAAAAAGAAGLVRALRAAGAPELRALLAAPRLQGALAGLCRALGLAGSAPAWAAARALLVPHAPDALPTLSQAYFAGLALSDDPQEEVVAEALRLGEEAALPDVAAAALLAGAAAVPRLPPVARSDLRARLHAARARCRDAECRALRTRALGNARDPAAAGALLAAAEAGAGAAAEAALTALRGARLAPEQGTRLRALAENATRSLPERALALELCVERASLGPGVALDAVRLARALGAERGAAAHELRRALWGRLEALGARAAVRALQAALPTDLRRWEARALAGTTLVLRRATGWAGAGRAAALDAALLAAGGVLRRGRVALLAPSADPQDEPAELLAVEVWTRGLEALAGGAGEGAAGDEGEGPGAGLQLSVAGAALPPVTLFSGQAELLAHVWSGAGAEPSPVLRALVPGGGRARAAPLQAGAALRARVQTGAALALDAHGTASLWYRTARAGLQLRAAGHVSAALHVRAPWAELRGRAELEAEPALGIEGDLDFYDTVALCVRAALPPHARRWVANLRAAHGDGARVRRRREARVAVAGRTLSLGRANDAACRTLRAPEDAE